MWCHFGSSLQVGGTKELWNTLPLTTNPAGSPAHSDPGGFGAVSAFLPLISRFQTAWVWSAPKISEFCTRQPTPQVNDSAPPGPPCAVDVQVASRRRWSSVTYCAPARPNKPVSSGGGVVSLAVIVMGLPDVPWMSASRRYPMS